MSCLEEICRRGRRKRSDFSLVGAYFGRDVLSASVRWGACDGYEEHLIVAALDILLNP